MYLGWDGGGGGGGRGCEGLRKKRKGERGSQNTMNEGNIERRKYREKKRGMEMEKIICNPSRIKIHVKLNRST